MPPPHQERKQRATRLGPWIALFNRFTIGTGYQRPSPYVPCSRRGRQGPAASGGRARCRGRCRRRSRQCRRLRLLRRRSIAQRGPPAGSARCHGHGAAQGRSGAWSCRDGEGRRREHGCVREGREGGLFLFCRMLFFHDALAWFVVPKKRVFLLFSLYHLSLSTSSSSAFAVSLFSIETHVFLRVPSLLNERMK